MQVSMVFTNLYFCSLFPLHPSPSIHKSCVIYLFLDVFHFIDLCIMCCLQWAPHQDMFTNNVAKEFPNGSNSDFGDNNTVDTGTTN